MVGGNFACDNSFFRFKWANNREYASPYVLFFWQRWVIKNKALDVWQVWGDWAPGSGVRAWQITNLFCDEILSFTSAGFYLLRRCFTQPECGDACDVRRVWLIGSGTVKTFEARYTGNLILVIDPVGPLWPKPMQWVSIVCRSSIIHHFFGK